MNHEYVAPLVGAWIETLSASQKSAYRESHPSWVRGLKLRHRYHHRLELRVAPLVGAWIETSGYKIEVKMMSSHPSWVRGLKLSFRLRFLRAQRSHPSWVRGLKHVSNHIIKIMMCRTPRGCVD